MLELPTVLLRHDSPAGLHHDWLLGDPQLVDDPEARLWTARVGPPSTDWTALGSWDLEPIQPHRRHYLTYQGPLSNGRGTVQRVDEGSFVPLIWTDRRILIDLTMRHCTGRIELTRLSPTHWRARLIGG